MSENEKEREKPKSSEASSKEPAIAPPPQTGEGEAQPDLRFEKEITRAGAIRAAILIGVLVLLGVLYWYFWIYRSTPKSLGKALLSRDVMTRIRAAEKLAAKKDQAEPAIKYLIGALEDETPAVYAHVMQTLGHLVSVKQNKEALNSLVGAIGTGSKKVKVAAIQILGQAGPTAREAIPALLRQIKDEDPLVRSSSIRALVSIGAKEEAFISAAFESLKDSDGMVKNEAASALVALGQQEKEIISRLIKLLDDPTMRLACISVLGQLRGVAEEAVASLLRLAKEQNARTRAAALAALASVAPKNNDVILALLGALKDADSSVRNVAVDSLVNIINASRGDAPMIEKALPQMEPGVRTRLEEAFRLARPKPQPTKSSTP